jgi:hypothetical protein
MEFEVATNWQLICNGQGQWARASVSLYFASKLQQWSSGFAALLL